MTKYMYVFPEGGFNNICQIIWKCYEYSLKYNRTLVIDTRYICTFRDDIRKYLIFTLPNVFDGDIDILFNSLKNTSTFYPKELKDVFTDDKINYKTIVSQFKFTKKGYLYNDINLTINDKIEKYLLKFDDPLLKTSLHTSLAKLNFDSDKLMFHFLEAENLLESIQEKDKIYYDLQRKLYFLELRLNFFSGKGVEELVEITDKIFKEGNKFSIINNNTIFYRILFKILDNKLEEANLFLEKNHIYFKGEGKMLEQFLKAVILEKTNEHKKAIQLLQPIIYSSNYFMSVFSRLLVIKIYTEQNNISLLKSLIDSTQRFLLINFDNPLGMDSHLYVLNTLKTKQIKTKNKKGIEIPKLTVFHKYLLE